MSIAKEKSSIKLYMLNMYSFLCVSGREREEEGQKNLGPKPISDERGLEEVEAAKETGEGTTNQ